MAIQGIILRSFVLGGIAESRYMGTENSLAALVGCDIHSEPGVLKANQKLTKISGSTIDAFCKVSIACSDGNSYWFSETTGKIWKITSGFTVSLAHTTTPETGGAGCIGAKEYKGYIYWATENRLHRIPVNATALADWSTYAEEDWEELNIEQEVGDTGNKYATTNAVNEGATHRMTYYPLYSPQESVAVNVDTVGTGDWVVTVHDASNNLIATKTIVNGSMSTGWIYFEFAAVWYPTLGNAYHVHIHTTVADGEVVASTHDDLEDGNMRIFTTSDASWHPMAIQNQILYIGDKNFVHQIESAEDANGVEVATFTFEALDIKEPLRIKCLGKIGTDILLGTYVNDNVNQTEILRWNTWSVSFSVADPIPETGINCFIPTDNYVLVSAGISGNLYIYDGQQLILYRSIPGTYSPTAYGEVYPGSAANFRGLPVFGFSNGSGNPASQGVYSFGQMSANFSKILNLEFPISQRSGSDFVLTNVEIGAILALGGNLLVAWKDSTSGTVYGVDKLDYSNKCNGAYFESRVMEIGVKELEKVSRFIANYESVPTHLEQTLGGDSNKYATTTAVNEGATHRQTYTPELLTQISIAVKIDTVGTGDWTVAVHDSSNTEVASKTIENGDMSTGWVTFTFAAPWYASSAAYHIHITTTVADGEVESDTHDDLEDGNVKVYGSCDVTLQYKENNGSWTDLTELIDTDRNQIKADHEVEAGSLQVRVILNCNDDDTPIIRNILVQ